MDRVHRLYVLDLSLKLYFIILVVVGSVTIFLGLINENHNGFSHTPLASLGRSHGKGNLKCPSAESLDHFLSIEKRLDGWTSHLSEDPALSHYVRIKHLSPPSHRPYPIENVKMIQEMAQLSPFTEFIADIFQHGKGRFIEVCYGGTVDCTTTSATATLERKWGWEGLVVMCNPFFVPIVRVHRRGSWIADVCLSETNASFKTRSSFQTSRRALQSKEGLNGIAFRNNFSADSNNGNADNTWERAEVQMIPLSMLIDALGWTEVDFLSLEMKGHEADILLNFPFDRVKFKILELSTFTLSEEKLEELNDVLEMNDYALVKDKVRDRYRLYAHLSIHDVVLENREAYYKLLN